MLLKDIKIGWALTGSHCTLKQVIKKMPELINEGAEIYPILSDSVLKTDTRFGKSAEWYRLLVETTGREPIKSITEAEPIGPQNQLDVVVIAPCTGNTLAKLANGITDSPVLMSVKAQLRNKKPVVLAVSTNDGLGINAKNIAVLINTKNVFMVPFGQDNPVEKANSLIADLGRLTATIVEALQGRQIQPVLITYQQP